MRRLLLGATALVATLFLPLAAQTPLAQSVPTTVVTGHVGLARVIVKYRADSGLMNPQALTARGQRLAQARALGRRVGVELVPGRGITERSHVLFARGMTSAQLATRLQAERDVEYAVPDERKHIVAAPNDPLYVTGPAITPSSGGPVVGQWYLKPPGAAGTAAHTAPSAINAEQAWDVVGAAGANVVVAVIDTGLRFDHADLQGGNVLPGYDMIAADDSDSSGSGGTDFSTANDGSGRDSDASDPGDWVTAAEVSNNPDFSGCTAGSSSWHGTQTLGLIGAATNNSRGIASVGQGIVKVMPVRALGKCGGFDSDIQVGMLWAAGVYSPAELSALNLPANPTPAKVISMSLGGTNSNGTRTCSMAYSDVVSRVTAAGVTVVVAAGNEDGLGVDIPASCSGVVAVAALRSLGDKVGFSNIGPEVAIAAPGGNCGNNDGTGGTSPCQYPIVSTTNSGTQGPVSNAAAGSIYTDGVADPALGTSFSTPLVAGTVALMLAVQPSLTPAEIKSLLRSSATPFPTSGSTLITTSPGTCTAPTSTPQSNCYCTTSTCGAGMLNAHSAVLAALGVQARISVTTAAPTAGQPVQIASSSIVGAGQSIATYAWSITSAGTTGAVITGAANASTVVVTPAAAGNFTIQLAVTDAVGVVSTASTTVTVAAAVVATPPPSGGGGGGALGVGWLVLLLGAVAALAVEARVQRRRRAAAAVPLRSPSGRR